MNPVTAILIGAGARGQIYARYAQEHPEELRIIAVAEPKGGPARFDVPRLRYPR